MNQNEELRYLSQYSVWLQTGWSQFDPGSGKGLFSSLCIQTGSGTNAY
jgi:hypothetical protein